MRKFLSLVLALVMTMSLVTVSAGAKEFDDQADITYVEAVDVISEIGVVDGYTSGDFGPNNGLTRQAAAKIICNLILGPTTAAELHADTAPFPDVPINHEFAGYIAYCAKEGIVGGYADGTFKGGNPLTGYAFMKMLLGALGYEASIEGYGVAGGKAEPNWSINVAKQAIGIGLNKGLTEEFNGVDYVTREEAALYAFNTLKATMVEYAEKTIINVGGADISLSSAREEVNWGTGTLNDGKIYNDNFVQFAERYFPKLRMEPTIDAFGRPAREWTYDGEAIGTFVNNEELVAEYSVEVTGHELYSLLGKSVVDSITRGGFEDYDLYVFIDGQDDATVNPALFNVSSISKNNKAGVGDTGNGVTTQVFVDTEDKEVTIAIINTYLARAKADYSEKKDQVDFYVYGIDKITGTTEYIKVVDSCKNTADDKQVLTVSGEDFTGIDTIVENDAYLVQIAEGEIQAMEAAEIMADSTLTAFKVNTNVVADGETVKYADAAEYDFEVLDKYTGNGTVNLKEKTYNVYLDQYGYMIGIDLVKTADNYVFITGVDTYNSNLAAKNNEAAAIFLDGTMDTITYNTTKSDAFTGNLALVNTWCTYTVDKNGVYTLKKVAAAINTDNGVKVAQAHDTASTNIDKKHVSLNGSGAPYTKVYGNDDTIYLTGKVFTVAAEWDTNEYGIINDVTNVTTGVAAASIELWNEATAKTEADKNAKVPAANAAHNAAYGAYSLYKSNGYIIASVVIGKDSAASDNLVYVTSSVVTQESYDSTADEWTWTRTVALDGVETELKEVGDSLTVLNGLAQYNWYVISYNGKGEVIDATLAEDELVNAIGTGAGQTGEYVEYIDWVEASINDEATVLYEATDSALPANTNKALHDQPKAPYLVASTFYVDTSAGKGFWTAQDVKFVFIQRNDNKTTTTFGEGIEDLEDVVADLNAAKDDAQYDYEVSAILKEGAAKVVVIRDLNDSTGIAPTVNPTFQSASKTVTAYLDTAAAGQVTFGVAGTASATLGEKYDAIRAAYAAVTNVVPEAVTATYDGATKEWTVTANGLQSKYTEQADLTNVYNSSTQSNTSNSIQDALNKETNPATQAILKELLDLSKSGYVTYDGVTVTPTAAGVTIKATVKKIPVATQVPGFGKEYNKTVKDQYVDTTTGFQMVGATHFAIINVIDDAGAGKFIMVGYDGTNTINGNITTLDSDAITFDLTWI